MANTVSQLHQPLIQDVSVLRRPCAQAGPAVAKFCAERVAKSCGGSVAKPSPVADGTEMLHLLIDNV